MAFIKAFFFFGAEPIILLFHTFHTFTKMELVIIHFLILPTLCVFLLHTIIHIELLRVFLLTDTVLLLTEKVMLAQA